MGFSGDSGFEGRKHDFIVDTEVSAIKWDGINLQPFFFLDDGFSISKKVKKMGLLALMVSPRVWAGIGIPVMLFSLLSNIDDVINSNNLGAWIISIITILLCIYLSKYLKNTTEVTEKFLPGDSIKIKYSDIHSINQRKISTGDTAVDIIYSEAGKTEKISFYVVNEMNTVNEETIQLFNILTDKWKECLG